MKTKKEILEMLENVEADKLTFNEETSIKGSIIVFLRWILQSTPPKRSIFKLTEQELQELCNILIDSNEHKITKITNRANVTIEIEILDSIIAIHNDLDVFRENGMHNIIKYADRIREMLQEA